MGQAERFTRIFSTGRASAPPSAPVGLGEAAGRPPNVAHVPTAIVAAAPPQTDRKSTRLNSSHLVISYAVFCLKKKKNSYLHSIAICKTTICLLLGRSTVE